MKKLFCLLAVLALLAQPLRAAEEPKCYLALTFDDGPSGELTERLLEGLAERQVHATFFVAATALRNFRIRFHTRRSRSRDRPAQQQPRLYAEDGLWNGAARSDRLCQRPVEDACGVPGAAVPPARRALRRHAFKSGKGRGAVGRFVVGRPVRLERGRVGRCSADGSVRGARRQDHPHARPVRAFGHVRPAGRRPAAGAGIHVLHRLGAGRAARHGASAGEVYTGFPPLDG